MVASGGACAGEPTLKKAPQYRTSPGALTWRTLISHKRYLITLNVARAHESPGPTRTPDDVGVKPVECAQFWCSGSS